MIDEIGLTLAPMIIHRLGQLYGTELWFRGLSESRQRKIAERRPDTPIEQSLDLSDKVDIVFKDPVLSDEVGRLGTRSKNKSESAWKQIVRLRHKVAHTDRLADSITEEECNSVREVARVAREAYGRLLGGLDDDPCRYRR